MRRDDDGKLRLTLEEWDAEVGHHLHLIEAGAEICENHARRLLGMPDWETRAGEKLLACQKLMEAALVRIANARQTMARKKEFNRVA